jgi:hypothetical protein
MNVLVLGHVKNGSQNSRWVLLDSKTGGIVTGKIANSAAVNIGGRFNVAVNDVRPVGHYGGKIAIPIILLWPVLQGANHSRWDVLYNGYHHTYLVPNNLNNSFSVMVHGEIGRLDR